MVPRPKAWQHGVVVAEWFHAPVHACRAGLPLAALRTLPADAPLCLTLLSAAGSWRSLTLHPHQLSDDTTLVGFAALGDGRGIGLVVQHPAGSWAAPTAPQVQWMWRRLQRRTPLAVAPPDALPGLDTIRVPLGPATAIHLLDPPPAPPPPPPPPEPMEPPPPPGLLAVERFWREGGQAYLEGWLHAYAAPIATAEFLQDEGPPVPLRRTPRPDLLPHYPMLPGADAGFAVRLPHQAGSALTCRVTTADGATHLLHHTLPGAEPHGAFGWDDPALLAARANHAWDSFLAEAETPGKDVVELGSRVVAMGSTALKDTFPHARSFIGVDIHPGPGVDVVADAHTLSARLGPATADALFSSAVLEHLAMPWLAAAEMNRTLRPGGLVFHRTHQCWPVHETPNDFFRFSDEALRVLFGPAHGFETIAAGMAFPMATHARDKAWPYSDHLPLNPTYGQSWILARKVAEIGPSPAPDTELSQRYPISGT